MIELLNISKKHNLPVFCVVYDIEATNDSIMNYISVISDRTDWEGKPLSETDIELNIKKNIETFEKSKGYNPNGNSRLTLTKVFTLNNITFDNQYIQDDNYLNNNIKLDEEIIEEIDCNIDNDLTHETDNKEDSSINNKRRSYNDV